MRRTLAIAVKEAFHLRRDRRTTGALVGMPVILLLLYGFALSFDVRDIRLAIVDLDGTRPSRELGGDFLRSGYFVPVHQGRDLRVLDPMFDSGEVQAALVLPSGYASALAAGRPVAVQFILDGSDSQTASTVLGYARQIVAAASPTAVVQPAQGPVLARSLVRYNPSLLSSRFLVPGLVAFILMITTVVATSLAVVREKERGTMESLRATPLRALELLLGKTLPYLVLGTVSAAGALAVAWLLFDVPILGSIGWLALVTVLFLLGGLGWGVLISTIADTQQVAFQMGLISSMLPTLLLSGFVFPISSMPGWVQGITYVVPARYFLAALRGIVLKGAGPEIWWAEGLALVAFAVAVLGVATIRTVRSL